VKQIIDDLTKSTFTVGSVPLKVTNEFPFRRFFQEEGEHPIAIFVPPQFQRAEDTRSTYARMTFRTVAAAENAKRVFQDKPVRFDFGSPSVALYLEVLDHELKFCRPVNQAVLDRYLEEISRRQTVPPPSAAADAAAIAEPYRSPARFPRSRSSASVIVPPAAAAAAPAPASAPASTRASKPLELMGLSSRAPDLMLYSSEEGQVRSPILQQFLDDRIEALKGKMEKAKAMAGDPCCDGKYVIFRELELGHGSQGTVYLGREASGVSLDFVAIKRRPLSTFDKEVLVHQHFQGKQVVHHAVRYRHLAEEATDQAIIVMDLVPVTLDDVMKQLGESLTPEDRFYLVSGMCVAVKALHDAGVVHRDVRLANFALSSSGEVTVIDFGLSRPCDNYETSITGNLLQPFEVVEAIKRSKRIPISFAVDVFMLGLCIYYVRIFAFQHFFFF
jgi:hypothetical protein